MAAVKLNGSNFCFHLKANICLPLVQTETPHHLVMSQLSQSCHHRVPVWASDERLEIGLITKAAKIQRKSYLFKFFEAQQHSPRLYYTWLYTYCNENSFALVLICNELNTPLNTYITFYEACCLYQSCPLSSLFFVCLMDEWWGAVWVWEHEGIWFIHHPAHSWTCSLSKLSNCWCGSKWTHPVALTHMK